MVEKTWRHTGVTPIWYPSDEVDAQMAHLGWGMAIILGSTFMWGLVWALVALELWAAVKEFCFDILIEKDTWLSSLFDWSMYQVGGALGLAVLFFG